MSQLDFRREENGYSVSEVDNYIARLHEEYRNAVEWSNEIEKNSERAFSEIEALRKENEKLNSDCRTLAAKLRELMQTGSEHELSIENAEREAGEIIESAKRNAASIVSGAQSHSSQIIAAAQERAAAIIREAEGKSASVLSKAEDECHNIILETTQKIDGLNGEINRLHDERNRLSEETGKLTALRNHIAGRIEEAKKLLDF